MRTVTLISALLLASTTLAAEPRRVVRVPASALDGRDMPDALRRIDYGSFVWLDLTEAQQQRLDAEGIRYEARPEATLIQLPARSFHTGDAAAPGIQAQAEAGLYLVQLAGPLRKEWGAQLLGQGLRIVAPLAPYNLIVWASPAVAHGAASLPFVRWAGPYLPEDRIPPRLWQPGVREGRLSVLLTEAGDVARALGQLQALCGAPIRRHATAGETLRVIVEFPDLPLDQALEAVAAIPEVLAIGYVPPRGSIRDEMSVQITADNAPGGAPENGYAAFLAEKAVDGSGVTVGVIDQGSDTAHPELSHGGPLCLNYQSASPAVACGATAPRCGSHGTQTAGIVLGDGSTDVSFTFSGTPFLKGQGVAPGARLFAQNFLCAPGGGSLPPSGPLGWMHLSKDQVDLGAYVSANSWGPDDFPQGYDADTREFDRMSRDGNPSSPATAEPVVFVLSIMNGGGGTSTQGTPDEGKNLIRVGGTKNRIAGDIDDLCTCSAHGPALDGRRLPDLVAPGQSVHSTNPSGGHTSGGVTGTSFASPHVSGAAALLTSWFLQDPDLGYRPSPALIKAILVGSADDLFGGRDADGALLPHRPDNKQGWGRMNLDRAVRPDLGTIYLDQAPERTFTDSGGSFTLDVEAVDPNQPMRVSLVWTDALGPGLGGASAAWVNDLDLVVQGSQTYLGNVFTGGWSTTGGGADTKNNVENVFLLEPGTAIWQIQVDAQSVLGDAVYSGTPSSSPADFDQDFALVCHNCRLSGSPTPTAVSSPTPTFTPTALLGDRNTHTPIATPSNTASSAPTTAVPTSTQVPSATLTPPSVESSSPTATSTASATATTASQPPTATPTPTLAPPALGAPGNGLTALGLLLLVLLQRLHAASRPTFSVRGSRR